MRPWLAVVGIIFLTLGVGVAASLYPAATGTPSTATTVSDPPPFALSPNETLVVSLSGSNGSSEQFQVAWHSSLSIQVLLGSSAGCDPSGHCWPAQTFDAWTSANAGNWSGDGPFHYPLQCTFTNHETTPTNVTVSSRATSSTPGHLAPVVVLVLALGAGALFVVGALALFLAIFLRGNPYGPGPQIVSRSAEDVEELTHEEEPGH